MASFITDNGTLAFDRSGNVLQGTDFSSAAIAGSGALVVSAGSLSLNVDNTYAGGTIVNGGTLALTRAARRRDRRHADHQPRRRGQGDCR